MRMSQRSVYPDSSICTCGYLPRGLVKGNGLKLATVVVVDGLQDGGGVGEDGEGISSNIDDDPLAVPKSG